MRFADGYATDVGAPPFSIISSAAKTSSTLRFRKFHPVTSGTDTMPSGILVDPLFDRGEPRHVGRSGPDPRRDVVPARPELQRDREVDTLRRGRARLRGRARRRELVTERVVDADVQVPRDGGT